MHLSMNVRNAPMTDASIQDAVRSAPSKPVGSTSRPMSRPMPSSARPISTRTPNSPSRFPIGYPRRVRRDRHPLQFHFPDKAGYRGRMYTPSPAGMAAPRTSSPARRARAMRRPDTMCARLGGYMVQSNPGHIGDDLDPRGRRRPDPLRLPRRGESARFSNMSCAQSLRRSRPITAMSSAAAAVAGARPCAWRTRPDVWDGALPFMGGGDMPSTAAPARRRPAPRPIAFGTMFNVQRMLGDKLLGVIDAMAPGGSGDPYAGLTPTSARSWPRSTAWVPARRRVDDRPPMGQMWQWTVDRRHDLPPGPAYFENFWTKPGYVGHDSPNCCRQDRINFTARSPGDVGQQSSRTMQTFAKPDFTPPGPCRGRRRWRPGMGNDLPSVIEVEGPDARLSPGHRRSVVPAARRPAAQSTAIAFVGDFFFCDGSGEANAVLLHRRQARRRGPRRQQPLARLRLLPSPPHHGGPAVRLSARRRRPIYPQHPPGRPVAPSWASPTPASTRAS